MTNKPITQSGDSDIRGSISALKRAATRAQELARHTGTRLVIGERGQVRYLPPEELGVAQPKETCRHN